MAEQLDTHQDVPRRLLCFPLSPQVSRSQIDQIVGLSILAHSDQTAYMKKFLKDQLGELLPIVSLEVLHNGNTAQEVSGQERRREFPFYPREFCHGVYAVCSILFAQAQENLDFADKGVYPVITGETYRTVKKQRFARQEHKSTFLRARFIKEKAKLFDEQPILGNALHAIVEGLELHGNKQLDFYGGAAFAYELFANA